MHASIAGIEYYLPETTITTEDLAAMFPERPIKKIASKTGVQSRSIASDEECASDLAVAAAQKLFESGSCKPDKVDFVLFCTQSPDYVFPTTACLLQERLGIPTSAGALDFNLGCSGFVYGLGLAEGLISSGQARSVLLITAETCSKYLGERDIAVRALLGDGAAATWVTCQDAGPVTIGPFVYGTDGRGGKNMIVLNSGSRKSKEVNSLCAKDQGSGLVRQPLFMDGQKIFDFAIETVPKSVSALLGKSGLAMEDIDLFVFHQANAYLLEEIRRLIGIPKEKFQLTISHCANTSSSTIPIALKHAELDGRLERGNRVMLVGFGVGYSWAATIIQWAGFSKSREG